MSSYIKPVHQAISPRQEFIMREVYQQHRKSIIRRVIEMSVDNSFEEGGHELQGTIDQFAISAAAANFTAFTIAREDFAFRCVSKAVKAADNAGMAAPEGEEKVEYKTDGGEKFYYYPSDVALNPHVGFNAPALISLELHMLCNQYESIPENSGTFPPLSLLDEYLASPAPSAAKIAWPLSGEHFAA